MKEIQSKIEVLILYTKDLLNTVGSDNPAALAIADSLISLEMALTKITGKDTLQ